MPLRVDESPECVVVRDRPTGMWLFGSIFVLAGLLVLSIPFMSTAWARFALWERASVLAIGLGHFLGGSWSVWRYVETQTTFDRIRGTGLHIVRRPFARRVTTTPFEVAEVRTVEIQQTTDNDGDPMYQLHIWLSGSRVLPLQGQPAHGEARALAAELKIRRALGLEGDDKTIIRSLRR